MPLSGVVKSFGPDKGFGFIVNPNGPDIFLPLKACVDGGIPQQGDTVTFDVEESQKKPGQYQAKNVRGGTATPQDKNKRSGLPGVFNGEVKHFNDEKGFGFIIGPDGTDVFLHKNAIVDGSTPQKGDNVTYDLEPSKSKPDQFVAQNVAGGTGWPGGGSGGGWNSGGGNKSNSWGGGGYGAAKGNSWGQKSGGDSGGPYGGGGGDGGGKGTDGGKGYSDQMMQAVMAMMGGDGWGGACGGGDSSWTGTASGGNSWSGAGGGDNSWNPAASGAGGDNSWSAIAGGAGGANSWSGAASGGAPAAAWSANAGADNAWNGMVGWPQAAP